MECKVFEVRSKSLQQAISDWLKENGNAKIKFISQCGSWDYTICTILYEV